MTVKTPRGSVTCSRSQLLSSDYKDKHILTYFKTQASGPNIVICTHTYVHIQAQLCTHKCNFTDYTLHTLYTCTRFMPICACMYHVHRHVHLQIFMYIHVHVYIHMHACKGMQYSYIIRWVHIFMCVQHVIVWLHHNLTSCSLLITEDV